MPVEQAAIFLSLVANGLALRQSTGEAAPDVAVLAQLVETGVGKRARRNKRARG